MEPIRIRVTRVIDFGITVTIVGIDLESNAPVMVHIDHRPFEAIWDTWKTANFPQPVTFDAERLTLNLDMDPDGDGGEEITDAPAA
jgi:hypothetical protein